MSATRTAAVNPLSWPDLAADISTAASHLAALVTLLDFADGADAEKVPVLNAKAFGLELAVRLADELALMAEQLEWTAQRVELVDEGAA